MLRRQFLFLQGPPGRFFSDLSEALIRAGHGTARINLNGGDREAWRGPATDFRGSARDWPFFFDRFVREHGITDLILFGDCRPMHRAAHRCATRRKVRIHVFEEGYIRPDWITLELDGVNGHSTLPREPDWYLHAARELPPYPAHPPLPFSFRRRAWEAFSYYTSVVVQRWRFPGYRSHRRPHAIREGLGWAGRWVARRRTRARSAATLAAIGDAPYFLFPLQLDSDCQVRVHSPFRDITAAIHFVTESFARCAPSEVLLIVKQHPLDNGLTQWRRVVRRAARRFGVRDRVLMLEDGDIDGLVKRASGLVTINSTTGTLALGAGIPTVSTGHAIYDIPRITHQGCLDSFWSGPTPPDPDVWDAFRRVLVDRSLVRGGFQSDVALATLVAGSVARLAA